MHYLTYLVMPDDQILILVVLNSRGPIGSGSNTLIRILNQEENFPILRAMLMPSTIGRFARMTGPKGVS